MIEIREHTDIQSHGLAEAWSGLEAAGGCPHVFLSRAWLVPWAQHFADGAKPLLLLGTERMGDRERTGNTKRTPEQHATAHSSAGRTVGLALFFPSPGGRLELPVNHVSQRGGFLAAAGAFNQAVLRHLAARRERLLLRSLTGSDARTVWETAGNAGFLLNRLPARVSPFVDTRGSWDDFLASRPRKVTHEWERKMRKLGREGAYEVKRLVPGSDPHALIDAMIEIEERSWKEASGSSITRRGDAAFYHALADSFTTSPPEDSELLPFWLEFDGRIIGFLFGIAYRGTYFALKTSFDETYRRLAPGVALFHHAIRHAFERGLDRFDFVGQRARWKDEWATGHTEHVTLRCYPRSVNGVARHFVDTHLKRVGKRVVGEGRH